ncbi:MAG: DNRLRE domain-containing protein, partial [Gammaproteobacteria bacterium]
MNRTIPARAAAGIAGIALLCTGLSAWAATATIPATDIADNTVAEDFPDNSSGACDSLFSGNTDIPAARRALMRFDIAANVPAGSIINSVTLSMTVTRGSNHVDSTFTLHPINAAWTEGTEGCGVRGGGQGEPSTGGVTWNTQPGFGAPSGSTLINSTTPVWNSTTAMVSDVQDWLDNPGTNYGWILIGDETNPTTTRRFDSREGGSPPELLIDFTPTGDTEACCEADGSCALTIVGSGTCGGTPQGTGTTCSPNLCPQPTGACCNADNSCSDAVDKLVCENAGGTFAGGNCNQADCGLTPFVEPLPVPPVLQPTGTRPDGVPQYTVSVVQA